MDSADDIIRLLGLRPHPEGGHFRETFRDERYLEGRAASTAIYFLLAAGERSHWHRVDAAEIWHFYAGAPLELSMAGEAERRIVRLGADWRRRAAADCGAGRRLAECAVPGRLDAGRLHRRARIRIRRIRARAGRLVAGHGLKPTLPLFSHSPPIGAAKSCPSLRLTEARLRA
jgi:hypothetical protein